MVTKPNLIFAATRSKRQQQEVLDFLRIDCTGSCLFVDVVAAAEVAVVAVAVVEVGAGAEAVEEEASNRGTSALRNQISLGLLATFCKLHLDTN